MTLLSDESVSVFQVTVLFLPQEGTNSRNSWWKSQEHDIHPVHYRAVKNAVSIFSHNYTCNFAINSGDLVYIRNQLLQRSMNTASRKRDVTPGQWKDSQTSKQDTQLNSPWMHLHQSLESVERPEKTTALPSKRPPVRKVRLKPHHCRLCGPGGRISAMFTNIPVGTIAGKYCVLEPHLNKVCVLILGRLVYLDDSGPAIQDWGKEWLDGIHHRCLASEQGRIVCWEGVGSKSALFICEIP